MFPYPVPQCQPPRGADLAGSDSVRAGFDPVDPRTVDVALQPRASQPTAAHAISVELHRECAGARAAAPKGLDLMCATRKDSRLEYLEKPIDAVSLCRAIRKVIQ